MKLPVVETEIQVRFSDLDHLGHVANNIYNQYLDMGRIEWYTTIPGDKPNTVVRRIEIEFLAEIKYQDKVLLRTWCRRIGNRSATISQEIFSNGKLVTKANVVIVGFDRKARSSCRLPEEWEASADQRALSAECTSIA